MALDNIPIYFIAMYLTVFVLLQSQSGQQVIIMELCRGGSLYNIIEMPENGYGLEETEFLNVLIDVSKYKLLF